MLNCGILPEEIDPMIKAFMEKDADKNNRIDLSEFKNILKELITKTLNELKIKDKSNDRTI